MADNAPAFQLYAADFYMDTVSWPIDAVGIYTRFLFYQWVNGFLPDDEKELSRIAGCSVKKLLNNSIYWSTKFQKKDDNKLINLRLEDTRKKQLEYREKQIISGSKGGKKKQENIQKKCSNFTNNPTSEPISENVALQSSVFSLHNNNLISANDIVSNEPDISKPAFKDNINQEEKLKNLRPVYSQVREKYPNFAIDLFIQNHRRGNIDAVTHTLKTLIVQHDKKIPIDNPMAWCETIIKVENGKYNAAESEQRNNEFKNDKNPLAALTKMVDNMLKPMPAG